MCRLRMAEVFRRAVVVLACLCPFASAGDWPTWLGDPSRSGSSEERLADVLKIAWAHKCDHAPSPAVRVPYGSATKTVTGTPQVQTSTNDNACQVVVAGGKLYFGSSTEESVTCLDARSGAPLWTFHCEGAVRFAPVCHEGKVYFGSDDGYVYCVDGASGKLAWKFQAAVGTRRIIANQRISSQWPVRTGLAIRDGTVYAACGIFPSEDRGVVLYALRAADGKPVWKQRLLIHAMGHLLAEEKSLIVPAGRAAPLDVRRADGTRPGYKFSARRDEGGGSPCTVAGMLVYGPNESAFLKVRTVPDPPQGKERSVTYDGSRVSGCITGLQGWRMVAVEGRIYVLRNDGLRALDRAAFTKALIASSREFHQRSKERRVFLKRHHQSRDEPVLMEDMKACAKWLAPNKTGLVSMIRAGGQIITGGKDIVQACSAADGRLLWSANVAGTVWDLAAAEGAVFASTDAGEVYCLRADGGWAGYPEKKRAPLFADEEQQPYEDFVRRVLERADTRKGYCVVAGLTDGRLVCEIARQTGFFVLGIDSDPTTVASVRETLSSAGLYGERVTIHQSKYENLPYLSYFANVVLSESAMAAGKLPCAADAIFPMVQPHGGLMVMAGTMGAGALTEWGKALNGWKVELKDGRAWGEIVRPKLEGAGEWTHMFATPANTLSSGDLRVGGTRYDVQWIGPPGTERQWGWHDNSMTALYKDGRVYLARRDHVMAVDAYNGTILWGLDVPGSLRLGVGHESGQACVDSDFLYVAATNDCWLIDVKTGNKVRTYAAPEPEMVRGDCRRSAPGQLPASQYQLRLFDAANGAERWSRSVVAGKEAYKHNVNIQPAVIMGDKIYLSMRTGGRLFTFDFATGKHTEMPNFRGSKGCGIMSGSATALFFRNMVSQTFDTVSGRTSWTSSISRPSCWLSNLPAGGLLLMPESSTGCDGTFAIQTSIVLVPQDTRRSGRRREEE